MSDLPNAEAVELARRAAFAIMSRGATRGADSPSDQVLRRLLALLAPRIGDCTISDRTSSAMLNAQISVDTREPSHYRLVIDPLAGKSFRELESAEVVGIASALDCRNVIERSVRLHRLGRAQLENFWLGFAHGDSGHVCKAYVSAIHPNLRRCLPELARDAGWLPTAVDRTFIAPYCRIVPMLGEVEGIGIAGSGDDIIATTIYVRSTVDWRLSASSALADRIGMPPSRAIARLLKLLASGLRALGWSLECDRSGKLVDLKLELILDGGAYVHRDVARIASAYAIDCDPLLALAVDIQDAGLALIRPPVPRVLSLRFVEGELRSLVGYYPIAA